MNEREIARQMVHCTGIITIFIATIIGKNLTGLGAVGVAGFVSFLSWWTRKKNAFREKLPIRVREIENIEDQAHEMLNSLERDEVIEKAPYFGAFNFFLAMGLVLLIFPMYAAILAIAIISISDAASTVIGVHLGRREIPYNRKKTLEGSTAFFVTAFLICLLFLRPEIAVVIALLTSFVESLPGLNDNFSVPVTVGLVLLVL